MASQGRADSWEVDNKTKRRPAPALSPVTGNPVINHCYIWRCVIMCSKGGSHQHSLLSKSDEHMSGVISVSAAISCLFCVVNLFSNCYNQGPPAHICCLLSGSCKDARSRHSIICNSLTHPFTNYIERGFPSFVFEFSCILFWISARHMIWHGREQGRRGSRKRNSDPGSRDLGGDPSTM